VALEHQNQDQLFHKIESAAEIKNAESNRAIAGKLLSRAARFNDLAKLVYLAVVLGFNVIFWVVAIREHTRSPEEYL
jgi:hypothetical protein